MDLQEITDVDGDDFFNNVPTAILPVRGKQKKRQAKAIVSRSIVEELDEEIENQPLKMIKGKQPGSMFQIR